MFFFKFFSLLPFRYLYFLSDLLAFIAENIIRYRRKLILVNLRKAFPEKTEKEIRKLKTAYYRNLTDVALESFKLLTIPPSDLENRIKVVHFEKLSKHYKNGLAVIAATSHLCNWEWMLARCSMLIDVPIDAVYQEIQSPFFENLMHQIRSRFGSTPVEKLTLFRESLKKRNTPHVVALVADQSPPLIDDHVVRSQFFNQDTVFYSGMARLAKSFKWPIVFVEMRRLNRGHYEIEIKDLCLSPDRYNEQMIIDNYAQLVESSIRKAPQNWLWSHNRWKWSTPQGQ